MRDVEPLLKTITSIYSTPGQPVAWSGVVSDIVDLTGAVAGAYMLINAENQHTEFSGQSGYSSEILQAYEGPNGAAKDVRFKYIHRLEPGRVFREFEYVPDKAEYDASEWIQYQLAAVGAYWCMTARISGHGLWHDYISVNRLYDRGPHTADEKADMQALLPHLARAAELHRTLMRLENRFGAVLAVLDKLLVGLVILDVKGSVAVANATARCICDESGALSIGSKGYLHAAVPRQDVELQALITRAGMTADGKGLCDGGSVVLSKRAGRRSLLAEVMPLRDDSFSDRDGLRGTAVFILDPDSSHVVSVEGLAKIFHLTPAEEAVATAVVNGAPLNEIAEQRRNSVETIRSQLKSVFGKTGTNSQLNLMRLAVKASPPVAAN